MTQELTYTETPEGYLLPDLALPDEPEYDIGRFGLMRRHYLKNHRKGLFSIMLMNGKLNEHLFEVDQAANDRLWLITKQMAEREGVTERLKSEDAMLWVQRMTNIRNRVEKIICAELIYA